MVARLTTAQRAWSSLPALPAEQESATFGRKASLDAAPAADDADDPGGGALGPLRVELDLCRRIELHPADRTLRRVIHGPTDKLATVERLQRLRGLVLTRVGGAPLASAGSLGATLEAFEQAGTGSDHPLDLEFEAPGWPPSDDERRRQQANNLYDPVAVETELTRGTLLSHLSSSAAGQSASWQRCRPARAST
jgi:hypothetical protein